MATMLKAVACPHCTSIIHLAIWLQVPLRALVVVINSNISEQVHFIRTSLVHSDSDKIRFCLHMSNKSTYVNNGRVF